MIVSGRGTGQPVSPADLKAVRDAVPEAPLYAGSGADPDTVAELLAVCRGIIVGTAIKEGGVVTAPVDPALAKAIVEAAR